VAFRLEEIIALSRTDERPHYTFRVYISKDPQTKVYKVSICGLKKEDRIVLYGGKEVVVAKIKDLIEHLAHAIHEITWFKGIEGME
jgi:hypothetical protein